MRPLFTAKKKLEHSDRSFWSLQSLLSSLSRREDLMLLLERCLFLLLLGITLVHSYIPTVQPPLKQANDYDENLPQIQKLTDSDRNPENLEQLLANERIGDAGEGEILPSEVLLSIGDETFEVPIEDVCQLRKNWSRSIRCEYVKLNSDDCEGGGYLLWVRYVECLQQTTPRVIVIIAGVLYMFFMFIMVSTVADDFFSPNVAAIVAHLGISESVAGVTFMAFGNGAPDIFQSIASILTVPNPKAGLALGALLGCTLVPVCKLGREKA